MAVRLVNQCRPAGSKAAIAGHRQGPDRALIEIAELGAGAHERGLLVAGQRQREEGFEQRAHVPRFLVKLPAHSGGPTRKQVMLRRHQRQESGSESGVGDGGIGEQTTDVAQHGLKRPCHACFRFPDLAKGPGMQAHDEQIGQRHGHIGGLE